MLWFISKLLYYLFELIYITSIWFTNKLQHAILGSIAKL